MKVGLGWCDTSPNRTLVQKVNAAAQRYEEKFGVAPDTCYVHPAMLDREVTVDGVTVKARRNVLRHHFFIGREEDPPGE